MNVVLLQNKLVLFVLFLSLIINDDVITYNDGSKILVSGFALQSGSIIRHPISISSSRAGNIISVVVRGSSSDNEYDSDDDDSDEYDYDDDDASVDVGDKDWRDFRAKLVMSESKPSKSSTTKSAVVFEDDGDLDGIGALFASEEDTMINIDNDGGKSVLSFKEKEEEQPLLTPLDPSQWAYDSGKIIEKGAIILGGVEQDYGFGLRQQYFHKAAILVLDHDENVFTKGIILNRPTSLTLEDDVNGIKWKVWFGGDVQGLDSAIPDIVCLHSLKDPQATRASMPVMKDIQWTSFDNAKQLVNIGAAKPNDFWVFAGYAGWGPQQLMGELDRKSWYMVATDSQTLLKELNKLGQTTITTTTKNPAKAPSAAAGDYVGDPRDAGLDTWTLLMNMIGRGEIAKECNGNFDDLMLKEWALQHLCSSSADSSSAMEEESGGIQDVLKSAVKNPLESLMKRVVQQKQEQNEKETEQQSSSSSSNPSEDVVTIREGTLLRASSADRSPFLLESQEYHKSVILVLSKDEAITIGVILNRIAPKGLDVQFKDTKTGKTSIVNMPLRFGGQYAVKGTDALLWLHCSPVLKTARIGAPVTINNNSDNKKGASTSTTMFSTSSNDQELWKCTADDVINAITRKLATTDDFIVVSGVSVWTKKGIMGSVGGRRQSAAAEQALALAAGLSLAVDEGGLQEDVQKGRFEVVPKSQISSIWDALRKQKVLTTEQFDTHIDEANEVWEASKSKAKSGGGDNGRNILLDLTSSSQDKNYGDENDDSNLVYKSNVKVSKLSDDALKSWVATFLLQNPTMEG